MRRFAWMVGAAVLAAGLAARATEAKAAGTPEALKAPETGWGITFGNFFGSDAKKGERPLYIYARSHGSDWLGAVGSSRKKYNGAWHVVDLSGVKIEGDRVAGRIYLMIVPDPWIPNDHKPAEIEMEMDARIVDGNQLDGTYKVLSCSSTDASLANLAKAGKVTGDITAAEAPLKLPDPVTFNFIFQNCLVGGDPEDTQRRMRVQVGISDGKVIGAVVSQISVQHVPFDETPFVMAPDAVKASASGITGKFSVPYWTRGGEAAVYHVEMKGGVVGGVASGRYNVKAERADGQMFERSSGFDGTYSEGAKEVKVEADDRPWYVEVEGVKPVAPGEHPRLFFRKGDVPGLKKRAETPAGQYLVARLKTLLGGGEAMPKDFNPATKAYDSNKYKAPVGAYSISHAAGFGFLYQLTGDQKYADLARQCVEVAWEGRRNFDDRYAWVAPGGELRAGPSIGWYAAAYDLAYDGWDPAFRKKFALAVQDYGDEKGGEWGKAEGITLKEMILTPKMGPNSNHYGAVVGGTGLAVLAIKGDPGTDPELLEKYDTVCQRNLVRNLTGGFGDGGFFYEGMGPGGISSDTAFVPYIQALRVAEGRDYTRPRPNASMVTMLRVWDLIGPPAVFPYRSSMGGTYGSAEFHRQRGGLSRGGQFCQGFGAVREDQKPALLWTYQNVVEPDASARTYDTVGEYPHRAMLALVNWPLDIAPQNPATVLPKVVRDSIYQYYLFRNRWQDPNDTVVTALLYGKNQGMKPRNVMVWGLGQRIQGPMLDAGTAGQFVPGEDGSGLLVSGDTALAVDFSGTSGAEVLVAIVGGSGAKGADKSPAAKAVEVKVDGRTWTVITLEPTGKHPEVKVEGKGIAVGKQKIAFDGGKLEMATFKPAKP